MSIAHSRKVSLHASHIRVIVGGAISGAIPSSGNAGFLRGSLYGLMRDPRIGSVRCTLKKTK